MVLHILIFILPIIPAVFVPNKYWAKLLDLTVSIKNTILIKTQLALGVNSMRNGEKMINALVELESCSIIKIKNSTLTLPKYKFYTDLIYSILEFSTKYGSPLRNTSKNIRLGLTKDYQFERKILKEFLGGLTQFALITIIIWLFASAVQTVMKVEISISTKIIMSTLQLIGVLLFIFTGKVVRKKEFRGFANYFSSIYILRSLVEVGVPIKTAIELSKVGSTTIIRPSYFTHIKTRISRMIERVQKSGTPILSEIEETTNELWYLHDDSFEKYIKKISVLKFGVLALFYLSSYFVFVMELFTHFVV